MTTKKDKYIDYCVNDLYKSTIIKDNCNIVEIINTDINFNIWVHTLIRINGMDSFMSIPTPMSKYFYNLGIPVNLYGVVFKKYVAKVCNRLEEMYMEYET